MMATNSDEFFIQNQPFLWRLLPCKGSPLSPHSKSYPHLHPTTYKRIQCLTRPSLRSSTRIRPISDVVKTETVHTLSASTHSVKVLYGDARYKAFFQEKNINAEETTREFESFFISLPRKGFCSHEWLWEIIDEVGIRMEEDDHGNGIWLWSELGELHWKISRYAWV